MIVRGRPASEPEDSRAMRVVVATAVEVGIVAVILQGAVDATAAVAAVLLAPVGYAFSYARRRRSGILIKVILAVGLLLALDWFIGHVRFATTIDQARIPLASLFLWVQVLHAFDVPRRRDLAFSMVSSTTLIAAAGALALTTSFIWILAIWAILAAGWLWLSARPAASGLTPAISMRRIHAGRRVRGYAPRSMAFSGLAAVVVASALFVAMPRLPASLIRTPPFRLSPGGGTPADPNISVTNPGLPPPGADGIVDFAPDAYPGFGDAMDLRSRGQLSDDIAFRVRAERPALWRAEAFDTFDGSVWTPSGDDWNSLPLSAESGSYEVSCGGCGRGPDSLLQTFYIDSQQPNLLFAAASPQRVYFPSGGLEVNRDGAIRAPILLDPGTVYSVESAVPTFTPEELRFVGGFDRTGPLAPYLQLPADLPERDRELAKTITADAPTQYDAVEAVQTWLHTHTAYDLTVPREPDGVDAVDWFLFRTRRGFCEHIASAMVVLLRSAGIPSRVVTGYGPGERNPFTGYFEVRRSDAHAWVEVLYPGAGWVPYDPTFGVPAAAHPWGSLVGQDVIEAVARAVRDGVPPGLRHAVGTSIHAIATGVGAIGHDWPAVLLLTVALATLLVLRRRRRRRAGRPPDEIGVAYEDLLDTLTAAGIARDPARTPAEVLHRAEAELSLPRELVRSASVVVETFERARFAPPDRRPDAEQVARARAEAARAATLRNHRPAVTSPDVPEHQAPA